MLDIDESHPEFVIYRQAPGYALLQAASLLTMNTNEIIAFVKHVNSLRAAHSNDDGNKADTAEVSLSNENALKAYQYIKLHLEHVKSKLTENPFTNSNNESSVSDDSTSTTSIPLQLGNEEEKLFWDYLLSLRERKLDIINEHLESLNEYIGFLSKKVKK